MRAVLEIRFNQMKIAFSIFEEFHQMFSIRQPSHHKQVKSDEKDEEEGHCCMCIVHVEFDLFH
jgi:hypothetical protein